MTDLETDTNLITQYALKMKRVLKAPNKIFFLFLYNALEVMMLLGLPSGGRGWHLYVYLCTHRHVHTHVD